MDAHAKAEMDTPSNDEAMAATKTSDEYGVRSFLVKRSAPSGTLCVPPWSRLGRRLRPLGGWLGTGRREAFDQALKCVLVADHVLVGHAQLLA